MKTTLRHLLLSTVLVGSLSATAQESNSTYRFRHPDTPRLLERYYQTVYSASDHALRTAKGDLLGNDLGKDNVTDVAIDPAGRMMAAISVDKKGKRTLQVFSTSEKGRRLHKFDSKALGEPTSAVFSADARTMMVATPKGIHILSLPKFALLSTIPTPGFEVEDMNVSPDGLFMAVRGGDKVGVYNMEQKSLRKTFEPGVKVNDAIFSPDSETLAILTEDGLLELYQTNSMKLRTSLEDLGDALAIDFTDNGKYVAVVTSPSTVEIINLIKPDDRRTITEENGEVRDLRFLTDAYNNPLLGMTTLNAIRAERIRNLEPFYSKLVSDEADRQMAEWLKMMPGETMEEYAARISDEGRRNQRRLFEDEAATSLAGDLLSMAEVSLGAYDRGSQLLEVNFSNLPSVYLSVPEAKVTTITSASDLDVTDPRYGVMADDSFELIYAKFHNRNNGDVYIYDNQDRVPMHFLEGDDNVVSLEVLQQQQMEEMKLQELKESIVAQAKHDKVISDHTNITVDSQIVPAYDADGNKILNYVVNVTYEVEPEFSAIEDFGPGKYRISESGAAGATLEIVKRAFENDFAQYLTPGRVVKVKLSGSADATPIVRGIPYDGVFGDFEDEPVRQNGVLAPLSVTKSSGIKTNEQLAFLRATAVKDWLEKNISTLANTNRDYTINVDVASGKGSEFRRINAEFTIVDVFAN